MLVYIVHGRLIAFDVFVFVVYVCYVMLVDYVIVVYNNDCCGLCIYMMFVVYTIGGCGLCVHMLVFWDARGQSQGGSQQMQSGISL